jgi:hypothetical protein
MRASQLRIIEQQAAGNQLASSSGFTARQKLPQNGHPWVPTLAIVFEYCWRYDKIWNLSSQARQGKRGRFEHALRDRYKARLTNPKLSVSVCALPSVDLLYCLLHPALFGCARVA